MPRTHKLNLATCLVGTNNNKHNNTWTFLPVVYRNSTQLTFLNGKILNFIYLFIYFLQCKIL